MVSTELREALVHNDDMEASDDRPGSRAWTCRQPGWKWAAVASGVVACGLLVGLVVVSTNKDSPSPSPASSHFSGAEQASIAASRPNSQPIEQQTGSAHQNGARTQSTYTQKPHLNAFLEWMAQPLTKPTNVSATFLIPSSPRGQPDYWQELLDNVTYPTSPKWLDFYTSKQLEDLVPKHVQTCKDNLYDWLVRRGISKKQLATGLTYVKVTGSTTELGKLFNVEYHQFTPPTGEGVYSAATDVIVLHGAPADCIDYVIGPHSTPMTPRRPLRKVPEGTFQHIGTVSSGLLPPWSEERSNTPGRRSASAPSPGASDSRRPCYDLYGRHTHNCSSRETCGVYALSGSKCCAMGETVVGGECVPSDPLESDPDRVKTINGQFVRKFYNMPSGSRVDSQWGVGQGLFETDEMNFDNEALEYYQNLFGFPPVKVERVGNTKNFAIVDEANLDVQCITATGAGSKTYYIIPGEVSGPGGSWAQELLRVFEWLEDPVQVQTISSSIATPEFSMHPGELKAANFMLLLIGLRGVGFFTASGDSGATMGGNNPLDLARTAEKSGSIWQGSVGSQWFINNHIQCNSFTIHIKNTTESSQDSFMQCSYPEMLNRGSTCGAQLGLDYYGGEDWHSVFTKVLATALKQEAQKQGNGCAIYEVENDSWFGSNCTCDDLPEVTIHPKKGEQPSYLITMKAGHGKTQFHNWCTFQGCQTYTWPTFMPHFPASSPVATSVGGTQGTKARTNGCQMVTDGPGEQCVSGERACSWATGGIVTSSGGFSNFFARPSYQDDSVDAYLADKSSGYLPPSSIFNSSNRAYPDVALTSSNSLLSTKYGKVILGQAGTSFAAPWFTGMITQLNSDLSAEAGKLVSVGPMNPLLYYLAKKSPAVFNDVLLGDNACTNDYCGIYGYSATLGWDPVTGHGSIDFTQVRSAVLELYRAHVAKSDKGQLQES